MATYKPLQSILLTSATSTVTFSGIDQQYTDLVLVAKPIFTTASNVNIRVNGDTGSNYSDTYLYGDGTSTYTTRDNNSTLMYFSGTSVGVTTANRDNGIAHFMNYSNTTTFKTSISRNGGRTVEAWVNLWRSTAAISSITFFCQGASNYLTGTIFTIYGIAAA